MADWGYALSQGISHAAGIGAGLINQDMQRQAKMDEYAEMKRLDEEMAIRAEERKRAMAEQDRAQVAQSANRQVGSEQRALLDNQVPSDWRSDDEMAQAVAPTRAPTTREKRDNLIQDGHFAQAAQMDQMASREDVAEHQRRADESIDKYHDRMAAARETEAYARKLALENAGKGSNGSILAGKKFDEAMLTKYIEKEGTTHYYLHTDSINPEKTSKSEAAKTEFSALVRNVNNPETAGQLASAARKAAEKEYPDDPIKADKAYLERLQVLHEATTPAQAKREPAKEPVKPADTVIPKEDKQQGMINSPQEERIDMGGISVPEGVNTREYSGVVADAKRMLTGSSPIGGWSLKDIDAVIEKSGQIGLAGKALEKIRRMREQRLEDVQKSYD